MENKISLDTLLFGNNKILTCVKDKKDLIGLIKNTCIGIKNGIIECIEPFEKIAKNYNISNTLKIDTTNKTILPGFIDCHTHLVFGGSRIDEYVASLTPLTKNDFALKSIKKGLDFSIEKTKLASKDELIESSKKKLNSMLSYGITSVEIKSGYGLDLETEVKQLEVIKELNKLDISIYPTFLGAHFWPKNIEKQKYIDILTKEMIPYISSKKLALFCDVWCDSGYYTAKESKQILEAALNFGIKPKIHTDAYSYIGGSDLAAEMKMISADHLNFTPKNSAIKMRDAGVIGVLLPGTDFSVSHPKPVDARSLIDIGLKVALGTNLNPGNYVESMQFVMILATRLHKMTPEEAILASTLHGACAINIEHKVGSLEVNKNADIQIWNTDDYRDIIYKFNQNPIEKVLKNGKIIYSAN